MKNFLETSCKKNYDIKTILLLDEHVENVFKSVAGQPIN